MRTLASVVIRGDVGNAVEDIVRTLVSPFDATDVEVRALVQHGDAVHAF